MSLKESLRETERKEGELKRKEKTKQNEIILWDLEGWRVGVKEAVEDFPPFPNMSVHSSFHL